MIKHKINVRIPKSIRGQYYNTFIFAPIQTCV